MTDVHYSSKAPNDFKQVTSCSSPIMKLRSPLECQEKCRKCPDCRFFEYRAIISEEICRLYETGKSELVGYPPEKASGLYPPDYDFGTSDTLILSTGPKVCGKHFLIEQIITIFGDPFLFSIRISNK